MRLNTTVKQICVTYRNILKEDGFVGQEELIEMLKADEMIPEQYRTEKGFEAIAEHIYIGANKRELTDERRMKLYKQGLTVKEMAEKEGVDTSSINYWLRKRKLVIKKACGNRQ